jgi:hypothetical protein
MNIDAHAKFVNKELDKLEAEEHEGEAAGFASDALELAAIVA